MDIEKLNISIVDGVTKLGDVNVGATIRKVNEIIDAVNNADPKSTKVLVTGDTSNPSAGYVSVHGLRKEDLDCPTYLAEVGEYVVLHARSNNDDYEFDSWSDGFKLKDRTILVDSSMVPGGITLEATFTGTTVMVTPTTNDPSMGNVSGGGNVTKGSDVTLVANPNTYYRFKEWQKNGVRIPDAGATYTFKATEDIALKAIFEAAPIGVIGVTAQTVENGIQLNSVSAENADTYEMSVNDGEYESFNPGVVISTQAKLKFRASNSVTGVTPKICGEMVCETDANKKPYTFSIYSTIHSFKYKTSEGAEYGNETEPGYANKVALVEGTRYYILCNGEEYEVYILPSNS